MRKRFLLIVWVDLLAGIVLFGLVFQDLIPGLDSIFAPSPPNVIFILLDAARSDHFSGYGYDKQTTPQIDKIAQEGALFLNNFSPGTHTLSSIPRLMSSRYISINLFQHDLMRWGSRWEFPETIFNRLDDQQILLPQIMSDNGYQVVAFHNHGCCLPTTELGKKFDRDYYCPVSSSQPKDEVLVSQIIAWIEDNYRKKQPFFIYYHIMSPHEPYPKKDEDYQILSKDSPEVIEAVRDKFHQRQHDTPENWSEEELRILQGLYDGNLRHSDHWIGILDQKLYELGLTKNTLVIITADHGERLGDHGSLGHAGPPWDELTHIPLIMRYPPAIPPHTRIEGFTESIDILPTILDICSISLPPDKKADGISLLPIIDQPSRAKKAVFTENSMRTKRYKYIVNGTSELVYDLKSDPAEKKNIAAVYPELAMKLGEIFQYFIAPYWRRFQSARRTVTPDFTFYYSSGVKVSPNDRVEVIDDIRKDSRSMIAAFPRSKSWVLNKQKVRWRLFCLPTNGIPPPITLSARVPDGRYRIDVLVESPFSILKSLDEFNLWYRFDSEASFQHIKEAIKRGKAYHYLHLGESEVKNKRFQMELDFRPRDGQPQIIHHIRFSPVDAGEPEPDTPISGAEIRRRRDSLKALGYL